MSMDWSNERYVRLYIRDTVTWRRWSWQARAVFGLLLRKVDRSGVLDTGRDEKHEALALIIDVPTDVAAVVLDEWTASGTVALRETAIFIPRFLEAQEAAHSDKMRQAESRARRAAATQRLPESARHELSQAVTDGHSASQVVTPAVLAVPSVPTSAVPAVPADPARKRSRKAEQQQLPVVPPPPPKPPAPPPRIARLHQLFAELREARLVLPPPDGLGLTHTPDEAPDWARSGAALGLIVKQLKERWPNDDEATQDGRIEAAMLEWLDEPYWASPTDKETHQPTTPFPWGAFITEKQFAKAIAKAFPKEAAA